MSITVLVGRGHRRLRTNAKSRCEWFVDSKGDAFVNQVISEHLGQAASDSEMHDAECFDGKTRNLWRVPNYEFILELRRNVPKLLPKVHIWRRIGNGKIEPWPF